MLLETGLFRYQGFGNCRSYCDLSVYLKSDIQLGPKALVIMKENVGNPGTSVTNASETIASIVYNKYLKPRGVKPSDVFWAENSQDEEAPDGSPSSWDKVTYTWLDNLPSKPKWETTSPQFINVLIASLSEEENELKVSTTKAV